MDEIVVPLDRPFGAPAPQMIYTIKSVQWILGDGSQEKFVRCGAIEFQGKTYIPLDAISRVLAGWGGEWRLRSSPMGSGPFIQAIYPESIG